MANSDTTVTQDYVDQQQSSQEEPSENGTVGGTIANGDSKWNINLRKYPSNLGSKDLQHFVQFDIYVRGKSKFDTGNRLYEVVKDNKAQLSPEEAGNAFDVTAGVVAGGLGFNGAKKIFGKTPNSGAGSSSSQKPPTNSTRQNGINTGKSLVVGGLVAEGAQLASEAIRKNNNILKPDKLFRISDSIALHMEQPPSVKYTMQYANKDLGLLAGLAGQAGSVTGSLLAAGGTGEGVAASIMAGLAKVPGLAGIPAQEMLQASAKVATNPFREVLFESVDFRTFNFKYRFMPKSIVEVRQIYEIIRLFKFHMHPELSSDRLFLIYPAEFQITYYFANKQNEYFHKLAPAALVDMQVDYGGEQMSSFIPDDMGSPPTEVNLTLTFKELEILTKEKIEKGY